MVASIKGVVEVINGDSIEQSKRCFSDLLCCPVIDSKNTAAPTDIDSALGKSRFVFINTLMSVTYNEKIIVMFIACYCSKKPERIDTQILTLIYFEGMSHEEAARVMGKTKRQTYHLAERGRAALRERLERMGWDDAL